MPDSYVIISPDTVTKPFSTSFESAAEAASGAAIKTGCKVRLYSINYGAVVIAFDKHGATIRKKARLSRARMEVAN